MLVPMTAPVRPVRSRCTALLAATLLAVGLGGFAVTSAGASTATAKKPAVTIDNFAFSPKTLTVKAGTKVTVKNSDSTTHTFTADKGAFDTGDIDSGSSATVTVKKPGTYAYHCNIHNSMHGTIKAT
jgi:plastocyanin